MREKTKSLYFRYLAAAFGSAMITSVYSIVDTAMVGQYHGPEGTAALAVVAPVWNIIYSLGLLTGIGGSVLFGTRRGTHGDGSENRYFTASAVLSVLLSILAWIGILLFEKPILFFFGADESLFALAHEYMRPVVCVFPLFLFNQMLAAFLRNDGSPTLATVGVLSGGIFNVFGDYFFVFTCDMGIYGAGLATAIGAAISFAVMLTHFAGKKNSLKFVSMGGFSKALSEMREITVTGFSSFFVDAAMGILTVFFNRQIMKYLGSDALAIYGPIIQVSTFVQCCAYSVGQAAQPIISANYGAGNPKRINEVLKLSVMTAAAFGIFWTAFSMACPNFYVKVFMSPTDAILEKAPPIIRTYAVSFLLLPFNIFSTYYFQAIMKPNTAFVISVARGFVISGILIYLLPAAFGADSIWLAMPICEFAVMIYGAAAIVRARKEPIPRSAD